MKKLFTFVFALPITVNNLFSPNLALPKLEQQLEKQQPTIVAKADKKADKIDKLSKITFDAKNPFGIVIQPQNIEIKLSISNFDKEKIAVQTDQSKPGVKNTVKITRKREVVGREKPRNIPEPTLNEKRALVQSAAATYGIPWQILEAVWQVETGKSWDTNKKSYAGATGPMQFMPGTWRKYRVDANGDGKAEITSAHDSVYAAAKYLAASGAASGEIDRALFSYNRSTAYVRKVKRIAQSLGY